MLSSEPLHCRAGPALGCGARAQQFYSNLSKFHFLRRPVERDLLFYAFKGTQRQPLPDTTLHVGGLQPLGDDLACSLRHDAKLNPNSDT